MSLFALFALILFLLGKYSAGLARLDRQRLLRPGAGYMLLGSLVLTVVALCEAAVYFGFASTDGYVARVFCLILGLAAVENLINLVLEIYRPRLRGQSARLLYESRVIGLLGQPGGLIRTAAQALDYQFGFKVSETWFYRFLEKALSWIILGQLAALWLSSVLVIVEPNELALLERFGRPVESRSVLRPGAHLKLPWPIDQVYRYKAQEIQSLVVGPSPDPQFENERTVLWTRPHYREEFNLLVASRDAAGRASTTGGERAVPANLLMASIPVQYQITNLVQWAYRHADAAKLLEGIAYREVSRYLVSVDVDQVMSYRRLEAGEAIRDRIQQAANAKGLGVRINLVGMQDIHPPVGNKQVAVAAAFEAVVGAIQQKQTNILDALAYEAQRIPAAQAEATNILSTARSEATTRIAVAQAEAGQFGNQIAALTAAPSVYMQRSLLETLARTVAGVNKYYIGTTNTANAIWLNLEQSIRKDILDQVILPPGSERQGQPPR
jgi:regulator of protease activity HflC (stomatin/prohibitin superfamily)